MIFEKYVIKGTNQYKIIEIQTRSLSKKKKN